MRKLRYWYKAIPPTLSSKDLVPTLLGGSIVYKNGKAIRVVGADQAKRLTSWRIEAVVWEEKHGA